MGHAIEVPDIVAVPHTLLIYADVILSPGAIISGLIRKSSLSEPNGPEDENKATSSKPKSIFVLVYLENVTLIPVERSDNAFKINPSRCVMNPTAAEVKARG
jgi:hypothetical protein